VRCVWKETYTFHRLEGQGKQAKNCQERAWGGNALANRLRSLWKGLTARVAPKAAIHSPRSAEEIRKMTIENRQLLRCGLRTLSLNGEELQGGDK
jgi:hypothetical protein